LPERISSQALIIASALVISRTWSALLACAADILIIAYALIRFRCALWPVTL
jgi:hypothetical protein